MKKALHYLVTLTLGTVALGGLLFLLWPIVDTARDEVTVYPVTKTEQGVLIPLNRSVYKVFAETQTVIYWMPGIQEVPDRLARCSVGDRFHWTCEYSDGSAVLTMDDGAFSSRSKSIERGPKQQMWYTSRLQWWKLSFWPDQ